MTAYTGGEQADYISGIDDSGLNYFSYSIESIGTVNMDTNGKTIESYEVYYTSKGDAKNGTWWTDTTQIVSVDTSANTLAYGDYDISDDGFYQLRCKYTDGTTGMVTWFSDVK